MMFSFFKQQPGSPADSRLKTVSLFLIFAGLVLLVVVELSFGLWGFMHKPLPFGFFVTGVTVTAAGCAGLMVDDVGRIMTRQWQKYIQRKGGTR